MKKIITVLLFSGFLFSLLPLNAQEKIQNKNQTETRQKRGLERQKRKGSRKNQVKVNPTNVQSNEQKKREIENREHSLDKNKKVKRFSVDENLPETVKKRNIP